MRVVFIVLAIIGLVFLGVMIAGGDGVPSQARNQQISTDIAGNGPPGPIGFLGGLLAPFAPRARLEASGGKCAEVTDSYVAESATRYRVLRARLAGGAEAAQIIFTAADAREDGSSGPYVLCLRAEAASVPLASNCENASDLKSTLSLPVGRKGGCLKWRAIGAGGTGSLVFD